MRCDFPLPPAGGGGSARQQPLANSVPRTAPPGRPAPAVCSNSSTTERTGGLADRAQALRCPPGSGDTDRRMESRSPCPPGGVRQSGDAAVVLGCGAFFLRIRPDTTRMETGEDGRIGPRDRVETARPRAGEAPREHGRPRVHEKPSENCIRQTSGELSPDLPRVPPSPFPSDPRGVWPVWGST